MSCTVAECHDPMLARGLCNKHYKRQRNHGDPLVVERIRKDDEARFWSKVDKNGPGGCWLWTGCIDRKGYSVFGVGDYRSQSGHRFAYQLLVGPIAPGLVIDHVFERGCRHHHCVNPAHLEPVTRAENARRAWAAGAYATGRVVEADEDGDRARYEWEQDR